MNPLTNDEIQNKAIAILKEQLMNINYQDAMKVLEATRDWFEKTCKCSVDWEKKV